MIFNSAFKGLSKSQHVSGTQTLLWA